MDSVGEGEGGKIWENGIAAVFYPYSWVLPNLDSPFGLFYSANPDR